ncbi:MmcQ/YjbR family DNA-binding protein [Virgibacillus oceani]|uniref:MmcQ/YjbR family DNA-binding protein n=1 Tax=Virgibacillus oceani TaxID=1479511 RepID=A0A917M280_9BACI|nr:MmcQ/YjbR family DNA-binding protein [Virgibacillus oceani]GGG72206.1 hypothetical protein GCM10011398_15710 [Virgibacillus oceani]
MATLEQLHSIVLSYPDTSEGTHFHMRSYDVSGKGFVSIDKDQSHVMLRLDRETINRVVHDDPEIFKEVWRNKKYLIGIRFELAKVPAKQLGQIVEQSWKTKAPKKLIKSFENR